MADTELFQTLDYILNRCDAASIEAVAEAVVRRRRNLSMFSAVGNIPDPERMAKEITGQISTGLGGIEIMKDSIREMMVRIIKEHAPELSADQIDELCQAWLPQDNFRISGQARGTAKKETLPRDVLISMIEQFISFSRGSMRKSVDQNLREEMGVWTERYWKAFPPVIRQIISDFLKDKITEKEFNSKIGIALEM
ncbi:MAG: hypothetical protein LBQ82_06750 [Treponema sp.]|jgi:hypothetical protein|nr:hypothetical protein [Treponema sp.]